MVRKIDKTTVEIQNSIDNQENFVLQGGAGSGKTESLKQTVEYISKKYPDKKLLCITHTNLAVDEIKLRVNGDFTVSTIHSFLNDLIKNFKINIKEEISKLFSLGKMEFPVEKESKYKGNDYKKKRHARYKKVYESCGALSYRLLNQSFEKVPGKKKFDLSYQYDKKGKIINNSLEVDLNKKIQQINEVIKRKIERLPSQLVHYNNRAFNNREELGYSHDGLIELSVLLIEKYEKLQKILQDKFQYILIDEYQDTNPGIIRAFIKKFSSDKNSIGLFGDAMQTIYDEGIGSVQEYIDKGELKEIIKGDNYRSSYPVVDFINNIRTDSIKQEVAFKLKDSGKYEKKSDRQGSVTFYYVFSQQKENPIEELIKYILKDKQEYVTLMLTNRSIATELEFGGIYSVFADRGLYPMERISEDFSSLLLKELYEILSAYNQENFNFIIEKIKKNGWVLRKAQDKIEIAKVLNELTSKNRSISETLEYAFKHNILRKTEQYENYIYIKDNFLFELENNNLFIDFENLFNQGGNTPNRISNMAPDTYSEDEFNEYKNQYIRKRFYNALFSTETKFKEVMNYYDYMLKDEKRRTMHKTKGSGIQNVAVVLDNFGWNEYDFTNIFNDDSSNKTSENSLNLFYVACSRAIENLIIMKFVKDEVEINKFKDKLENEEVNIRFKEIKMSEFC